MKYRPEIDGLRAIAVLPVILFHGAVPCFSGGFIGVDVFFVISGFLICSLLQKEISTGTFTLKRFYERRAKRILPILFFVIAATIPFSWIYLLPSEMVSFSKSIVSVLTFTSNIFFWSETGYWDAAVDLKPLLHTWSLGIEEQFYIFFPILLIVLFKFNKKLIPISILLLTIASLFAAQRTTLRAPDANFYLLPTRSWELGIGALISTNFVGLKSFISRFERKRLVFETLNAVGLLAILYSIFVFDEHTPHPSLVTLIPTLGTGLILLCGSEDTLVKKFLSAKYITLIGLISYSMYLWHKPIFAFVRHKNLEEPHFTVFILLTLVVIVISYLTWKYIETPFRKKDGLKSMVIKMVFVLPPLVFLLFGLTGIATKGFDFRIDGKKFKNYQPDREELRRHSWDILRSHAESDDYFISENEADKKLWFDTLDNRYKVLLVGNSHSKDLYNTLEYSIHFQNGYQKARYGIQIAEISNDNSFWNSINYNVADIVMICSMYSSSDFNGLQEVVPRLLKEGKKVIIVKQVMPFPDNGTKTLADKIIQKDQLLQTDVNSAYISSTVNKINSAFYQEFMKYEEDYHKNDSVYNSYRVLEDVLVLDRMDYICDNQKKTCYAINNELEKFFYDFGHNTIVGAQFFGQRIDTIGWLEKLDDWQMNPNSPPNKTPYSRES